MKPPLRRIAWKWLLPALMLALTLACHVFQTYVFRHYSDHGDSIESVFQVKPTWPGQLELGIGFPALILALPFRGLQTELIVRELGGARIDVTFHDLAFIVWVALLWHAAGRKLDRLSGRSLGRCWPRAARLTGLGAAGSLGVLCAVLADLEMHSRFLPQRRIALCGLVWAALLSAFAGWAISRESGWQPGRFATAAAFSLLGLVTACWVGGPLCAAQGAGEYLRVSTVRPEPDPSCSANGVPPPHLRRMIEIQARAHHLTIQRMVVCRPPYRIWRSELMRLLRIHADPGEPWLRSAQPELQFQYRRYFVLTVADVVGLEMVYVQADLIQSRWDYLRENWNRIEPAWSWPYTGPMPTGGMW